MGIELYISVIYFTCTNLYNNEMVNFTVQSNSTPSDKEIAIINQSDNTATDDATPKVTVTTPSPEKTTEPTKVCRHCSLPGHKMRNSLQCLVNPKNPGYADYINEQNKIIDNQSSNTESESISNNSYMENDMDWAEDDPQANSLNLDQTDIISESGTTLN